MGRNKKSEKAIIEKRTQPTKQESKLVATHQSFSGPIPPPIVLKEYNDICPGAADRILKMAEDQSTHRQRLEKEVITSDIKNEKRGQLFGFLIGVTGITASVFLGVFASSWAAVLLGGGTLVSLTSVFVYGKRQSTKALQEKE